MGGGVIRMHKSKKDRQHNGQRKKEKGTNNDLQNTSLSPPFFMEMSVLGQRLITRVLEVLILHLLLRVFYWILELFRQSSIFV